MAKKGWNPLTYYLLDFEKLEKNNTPISNAKQLLIISREASKKLIELNLINGVAKTIWAKNTRYKNRH
jgi:hypothetical protein